MRYRPCFTVSIRLLAALGANRGQKEERRSLGARLVIVFLLSNGRHVRSAVILVWAAVSAVVVVVHSAAHRVAVRLSGPERINLRTCFVFPVLCPIAFAHFARAR